MNHVAATPMTVGRNGWPLWPGLLAAGAAGWLGACALVWSRGHAGLGTDSYGATWGITVVNILHLIGISHVGIAISASVRVLGLGAYKSVARLAELVTVVALVTAVLEIMVDVGRPDRFLLTTALRGRWQAPMVWSMTVITAYLLTSAVYLYLSLRRDFSVLASMDLGRRGPYRALALGYEESPANSRRHERTLYWLAVLLVPVMVAVHSVYGLFFGLLRARPGWFNPLQGPFFVLGAVVSGFSAVLVLAALLRRAYRWRLVLEDRMFKVFAALLAFVVFLYLYFILSEHLTAQYAGPAAERAVSTAMLVGPHAWTFWVTVGGGLLAPFLVLFAQATRPAVSVPTVAVAALAVNLAMWSKRYLLLIPTQLLSALPPPRAQVGYGPTALELWVTFGSYAFAALLLLLLLRWVPLVELAEATPAHRGRLDQPGRRSATAPGQNRRLTVVLGLVLVGSFLIAWGLVVRELDGAPVRWLAGIAVLAAIPLAICLIPDVPVARDLTKGVEASP